MKHLVPLLFLVPLVLSSPAHAQQSGLPSQAGLFSGKLPVSDPTAGNVYVGGPSDTYRAVVADLAKKKPTVDDLAELANRIEKLRRADLGERPYDAKLELQLQLLEVIGKNSERLKEATDRLAPLTGLMSAFPPPPGWNGPSRQDASSQNYILHREALSLAMIEARLSPERGIRTRFAADDAPRIGALIRKHDLHDAALTTRLLDAVARLPAKVTPLALSVIPARTRVVLQSLGPATSTGPNGAIALTLVVEGDDTPLFVRRITVKTAVDDHGQSLLPALPRGGSVATTPPLSPSLTAMMRAEEQDVPMPIGGSVSVRNPAPGTQFVSLIEGEMELFAPTTANGGLAIIADFDARPGSPLEAPILSEYGIELIPLTPATYATMQPALSLRGGLPPNIDDSGIFIYQRDPNQRLGGLVFQDPEGRYLPWSGIEGRVSLDGGTLNKYRMRQVPNPGAHLVAYVLSPEATFTVPFRFENVAVSERVSSQRPTGK